MHYPPEELAARLAVLTQNVVAIETYMVRLADVVADTKRQLEELRTGRVVPAGGPPPLKLVSRNQDTAAGTSE
jgi:hypothetical protein